MIDRVELGESAGKYHLGIAEDLLSEGDDEGLGYLVHACGFFRLSESPDGLELCKELLPEGVTLKEFEEGYTKFTGKNPVRYAIAFLDVLDEKYGHLLRNNEEIEAIDRLHTIIINGWPGRMIF